MSIDTGLGITYRENYPVPGINQSSQQFRDNFRVTRYALENIHAARTSSSSILDLSFTVNELNGQVQFNLGYVDPNSLPQNLSSGALRYKDNAIEFWDGIQWRRMQVPGTVEFSNTVADIVSNVFFTNHRGIASNYDPVTHKVSLDVHDFDIGITGAVIGSATVTDLADVSINTILEPVAVQEVIGLMVTNNQERGIAVAYDSDNGKLNFNVQDFQLSLTGDVTGSTFITDLADASLAVTLNREAVEDIVGAMVSGNIESNGIRVTYDDDRGKLNFQLIGLDSSSAADPLTVVLRDSQANFAANEITANLFRGTATEALYADVAERYHAEFYVEPGTVVIFGGRNEITTTVFPEDRRVAGVISTAPAFKMNAEAGTDDTHPYVALVGRVPCKVIGDIRKGDLLTTSAVEGHAMRADFPQLGTIIGKALSDHSGPAGVIEISVQRM